MQRPSPAALLDPNHPLVCGAALRADLWRQSSATAAVLLFGTLGTASGRGWGLPLLVAGAIVQLGLGVALALNAQLQRERARELIIAGRGELPLAALEREQRRLKRPHHRVGLARALEDLVQTAERWPMLVPSARPVFDPRQVRTAAPELRAIAARLRVSTVTVGAVARVERLLTSGGSPLYDREPEALRQETERICADLNRADPVGPAPAPPAPRT